MYPSLLSPRSKAACGVCRAYQSGGGGQPQTSSHSFRPAFKSRTGPRGAGARGCGPSARLRGGGFRAVAPAARPLRRPCPHSLSGSRRCPHFMSPGRPAPGLRSKGTTACGRWWGLPSGPLGRPGVMWRPRPGPCGPRPGQVGRLRCSGAPLRNARPSPCGAACSGPCVAPPPRRLRRRCSGAARPPLCGGCGAVRPSGPSRLRRSGVAAASPSPPAAAEPGLSAGGSLACGPSPGPWPSRSPPALRGGNFDAARKGPSKLGPFARMAGGWGAGVRRLRAGMPDPGEPVKPQGL